jgi:hypothetical protein
MKRAAPSATTKIAAMTAPATIPAIAPRDSDIPGEAAALRAQEEESNTQDLKQVPVVGPPLLPARQVSDVHQPQTPSAVQVEHVVALAHSETRHKARAVTRLGHDCKVAEEATPHEDDEEHHAQPGAAAHKLQDWNDGHEVVHDAPAPLNHCAEHISDNGAVALPWKQAPEPVGPPLLHQPHPGIVEHAKQVVAEPQLAGGNEPHPEELCCQDPMQAAFVGPAELPERQNPDVHQPQPARAVQVEQVVALQQEVTGHWLRELTRMAHDAGGVDERTHVDDEEHHEQPKAVVQAAHEV